MKKVILGTIKRYRDGRLVGIRPYWFYEIEEYKTPLLDFLIKAYKGITEIPTINLQELMKNG